MAEVNIYDDQMGNTLTVWFGDHDLIFGTAIGDQGELRIAPENRR